MANGKLRVGEKALKSTAVDTWCSLVACKQLWKLYRLFWGYKLIGDVARTLVHLMVCVGFWVVAAGPFQQFHKLQWLRTNPPPHNSFKQSWETSMFQLRAKVLPSTPQWQHWKPPPGRKTFQSFGSFNWTKTSTQSQSNASQIMQHLRVKRWSCVLTKAWSRVFTGLCRDFVRWSSMTFEMSCAT